MVPKLRNITVLGLALLIGFTSIQFAAARGQSPAVGMMEICTGTGPVHILVDENGEPTGGVMLCPDYALAFFADVWGGLPQATWDAQWRAISVSQGAIRLSTNALPSAQARGPPILV
jgi:hypothetical protein